MNCLWCSKPSDLAYHAACWRRMQTAETKDGETIMTEAHEAIAALKRGETVHVTVACMAVYGANIKKHRQLATKKQGARRNVGTV